jgi:hypothetical protein
MAERTYPGVYIEEKAGGPGPIQGVSTSALGLVGFATKGPTNTPKLVTSFPEFQAAFGDFTSKSLGPTEAFAFFQNKGKQLYYVRVVHEADAADGSSFLTKRVTAENGVVGDGTSLTYSFSLAKSPVIAAGAYGTAPYVFTAANSIVIDDGAGIVTTEMVVYEWMGRAGTPAFKELLPLFR